MPSPFPGMDPYLEDPDLWPDLHVTLIVAMRAALNALLPPGYSASVDRHVWIEDPEAEERQLREPDVHIVKLRGKAPVKKTNGVLAVAEPETIVLPMHGGKGKPYLKIIDIQDRHIITAIELLSPSNKKTGKERDAYLSQRQEYFAAAVNLVEINLLRTGRAPSFGEYQLPPASYYQLVCRAAEWPAARIWPFTVRQPFPNLPVPLRGDEQVVFNLRPCLDRACQEAQYEREIDYRKPPVPALLEKDAAWAKKVLAESQRK